MYARSIILSLSTLAMTLAATSLSAQVTTRRSKEASRVIAKWLSKSTGHYDYLSATSVATKRAGDRFFGRPDLQMASDYGVSYVQVPRDHNVTDAYKTIGADTSGMERSLALTRFHLNLGFANKHDFTFSYLYSNQDEIKGWGLGYKRVLAHSGYSYLTYRVHYSRSERDDYFQSTSIMNDLSASLYLRLLDVYVGARHWSGKVNFNSSIPALKLPEVEYISDLNEIEYYTGMVLATTVNSRVTVEANTIGDAYSIAGKFSFHFDSLFPTANNWFRDPRYIKQ